MSVPVPSRLGHARGKWWLLAKQRQPGKPAAEPAQAPPRPALQEVSQFMLLEREVEIEYRPRMLEALQNKVDAVADSLQGQVPVCSQCHQTISVMTPKPSPGWRAVAAYTPR